MLYEVITFVGLGHFCHQPLDKCDNGKDFAKGGRQVADAYLNGAEIRVRPHIPPQIV